MQSDVLALVAHVAVDDSDLANVSDVRLTCPYERFYTSDLLLLINYYECNQLISYSI